MMTEDGVGKISAPTPRPSGWGTGWWGAQWAPSFSLEHGEIGKGSDITVASVTCNLDIKVRCKRDKDEAQLKNLNMCPD